MADPSPSPPTVHLLTDVTNTLPVRIFYSVAELARAGNVPPYRLLRLLRRNGITFLRAGRAYYVALDEIRRKIPPLWRSIRVAEELRRGLATVTPSGR